MITRLLFIGFLFVVDIGAYSQGTFQDLDFENATLVPLGPGYSAASAFPAWECLVGTTPTTVVYLDARPLGSAEVSLINNNPSEGAAPLQGNYSASLFSTPSTTTTLSQTGLVPAGTQSIQMDASEQLGSFSVTLGGQPIKMVAWETLRDYTVYAGNVSSLAGQSANLSITENFPINPNNYPAGVEIDDIIFSPTAVTPEPSPLILTGMGGILFGVYRRFWHRI